MTDIIDLAADREAENLANALAEQARRAGLAGKTVADSATECACGAAIPEGRRQALPGVQRCLACQNDFEKQGKKWTPNF